MMNIDILKEFFQLKVKKQSLAVWIVKMFFSTDPLQNMPCVIYFDYTVNNSFTKANIHSA